MPCNHRGMPCCSADGRTEEYSMREIVLLCPQAHAEALADFLLEAGVLSVSVEDADGDTEAEVPLFGEPGLEPEVQAWQRNRVVALLPDDLAPEPLAQQAHEQGWLTRAEDWEQREVPDTDWVRLTQSQFGPIEVGSRIWITPSWHENDEVPGALAEQADDAIVRIRLDPGLAFGTGSH